MKKSTIVTVVIALLVLIGAAIFIFKPSKTSAPSSKSDDHSSSENSSGTTANNNASAAVTITYNGSSFSLTADTIKSGQTIKVTNDSDEELDFDSDPHPTHTNNPELNIGNVEPHHSVTATLKTTGKWGFHNHHNASQHGFITVE
jgi:uncharacterized protein YxeA